MTATRTLPDKIAELLEAHNGILTDDEGKVYALVASMLGESDIPTVHGAVEALRNNRLVVQSSRKIELTREGRAYAEKLASRKGGGSNGNGSALGIEPADPAVVLKLKRRPSVVGALLDEFLRSGQAAVRVTGYPGKRGSLATSLKSYATKNGYADRVEVRTAGGDVYLLLSTHADVIAAQKTKTKA